MRNQAPTRTFRMLHNNWYMLRFTSILLVPLGFWFVYGIVMLSSGGTIDASTLQEFLDSPVNLFSFALFAIILGYHSYMAMHEIIEDYIPRTSRELWFSILQVLTICGIALALASLMMITGKF